MNTHIKNYVKRMPFCIFPASHYARNRDYILREPHWEIQSQQQDILITVLKSPVWLFGQSQCMAHTGKTSEDFKLWFMINITVTKTKKKIAFHEFFSN